MGWVSLWVVPRVLSFVCDHLTSMRLKGRCLNGVWQGVVELVQYMHQTTASFS